MKNAWIFILFMFFLSDSHAQNKNNKRNIHDIIYLHYQPDSISVGNKRYTDEFRNILHGCYAVKTLYDRGVFGDGVPVAGTLGSTYIGNACFNEGIPYGKWVYRQDWGNNSRTIQTEYFENGYLHGLFKIETITGSNLYYETIFNHGTGYYINMCPYVMYAQGQLNKGEKDGIWVELSMFYLKIGHITIRQYDNGKLSSRKLFREEKMDRSSKKIEFSVKQAFKDTTQYHLEFYEDSLPRIQGMIYEGKRTGWWILADGNYSDVSKIILQLYENGRRIKKKRILFVLQKE